MVSTNHGYVEIKHTFIWEHIKDHWKKNSGYVWTNKKKCNRDSDSSENARTMDTALSSIAL